MSLFVEDYGQKRPVIKVPEYRCSDETILSGYRPNVDVDLNNIYKQIRLVKGEQFEEDVPDFGENELASYCTSVNGWVCEIVNNNQLYNTDHKKVDALVKVYKG
jgi:hypothetical protein